MHITEFPDRLRRFFTVGLWRSRSGDAPWPKRWALATLRIGYALARDLARGDLTLRAMSLVYTTLLSLAPFLAVSFSVLKAFGVHNQIAPFLTRFLAPLGPEGAELTRRIVGFVENIRIGVLGALGLVFLIYTVVSLLQKIEDTFNYVWHTRHSRSVGRRFSDYLSVILVGPVLLFAAVGLTASLMTTAVVRTLAEIGPLGALVAVISQIMPYVFVIGAFTFVYVFVPNVRVRLSSAFVGAVVAGVLWQSTAMAFASFAASSTNYEAIYSGFAILILFMIWLYVNWLIVLVGAQVAYYYQHPEMTRLGSERQHLNARTRELLGLQGMYLIAWHHHEGRRPWSISALAEGLGVSGDTMESVLETLVRGRLLIRSGEPALYLPARDIATVTLAEIVACLRGGGRRSGFQLPHRAHYQEAQAVVGDVERVLQERLTQSLRDWVIEGYAPTSGRRPHPPREASVNAAAPGRE